MRKAILIGLPALACATSCTPPAPVRPAAQAGAPSAAPVRDSRTLLARLDLDVPADLAAQPLPASVPDGRAALLPAPAFAPGNWSLDTAQRATDCLTAAVYYEARSEPVDGQRAVAQVVLNRVRDLAFPKSVCGVVFQGANRTTGCQFSFTCDGSMNRQRDWSAWARSKEVARAALAGSVYSPVGSATHFHTTAISPWWAPSLARIGIVGSHIFYRWASGMERALAFRQSYAGYEPTIDAGAVAPAGGVAIHYGSGDSVAGVTIHRGAPEVATPIVAPVAAVTPATAIVVPPARPRSYFAGGVRIHLGIDAAGVDQTPRSDGAIIADES